MLVQAKNFKLKNGKPALLKSIMPTEAEVFLASYIQMSGESTNLNNYPEEIKYTVEFEEKLIKHMNESPTKFFIGAYVDNEYVGNVSLMQKTSIKEGHRAGIAIAILKKYWGLGIGKALMEYALETAKNMGIKLVDLNVLSTNAQAIGLYESLGFVRAGEIPNAFILKDGSSCGDVVMYKPL